MTPETFKALVRELIEDNPFAIRAVLRILGIDFTDEIPTLAVTCEERPRLLVNLAFVKAHCSTEEHAKALICHEFLHVLLRHTERRDPVTPSEHLATDAVINAIIHRELGPAYSSMMGAYYAEAPGLMRLLRPMTGKDRPSFLLRAWKGLYGGQLVVDDIRELAESFGFIQISLGLLLGNHTVGTRPLPKDLEEALNDSLRAMNGSGIWRAPKARGVGAHSYETLFTAKDEAVAGWRRTALAVLKRHVMPDRRSRADALDESVSRMPILNSRDRRAFVRSLWDPFIPDAAWRVWTPRRSGTAQVYLDVSGSMSAEMPHIVSLLNRLRRHIRMPFWAFSNEVSPAVIERGQLKTRTTGGTSMACVLRHLAKTRPAAAVVVTDGYIEEISPADVWTAGAVRLHAIVSRDGNPSALARAGIPYSQLERCPA